MRLVERRTSTGGVGWELHTSHGIIPPTTVGVWRVASYAGFKNDMCCPNPGCNGRVLLNPKATIEHPTRRVGVTGRTVACDGPCGLFMVKVTLDGRKWLFGKGVSYMEVYE
jgi:hypothetical protein